MSDEVLVEVDGGVAVITINRPKARNAVNGAVARGHRRRRSTSWTPGRTSPRYVLTGAGGTFSAGMDLKGFLTGDMPVVGGPRLRRHHRVAAEEALVAAVEGYALAGGFELALACDLIVASAEAKFGLPEPKRGLVAAAGGVMRLPRRIPYHVAMEIALTGDHYPAARLHELGLVNRVTERGRRWRGDRAGPQDRRQRAARAGRDQADRDRVAGLVAGRDVPQAERDHRPGVHLQGRHGGRRGLRREARPPVEGRIATSSPPPASGRGDWPCASRRFLRTDDT